MSNQPRRLRVALTGGGTAGHVMPHLALLPLMRERSWDVFYIGSSGIERELISKAGIEFKTIASGKLRRYFSLENFFDAFKVALGFLQSLVILVRRRPDVVFSKGGFVSVPVALAAWCLGVPVVSHESDVTPGLANRIIKRFAARLLYSFPETERFLPKDRAELVGSAVRQELLRGDKEKGQQICGFYAHDSIPTIMIMGGTQGSQRINDVLKEALPDLVQHFNIVHLTGRGKSVDFHHSRYKSFEFVSEELRDLFALSDYIISRAGANSIFEFLSLRKPMLLIPLQQGSRGDQIDNAKSFVKNGWAILLSEDELSKATLLSGLKSLVENSEPMRLAQERFKGRDSVTQILAVLETVANGGSAKIKR